MIRDILPIKKIMLLNNKENKRKKTKEVKFLFVNITINSYYIIQELKDKILLLEYFEYI